MQFAAAVFDAVHSAGGGVAGVASSPFRQRPRPTKHKSPRKSPRSSSRSGPVRVQVTLRCHRQTPGLVLNNAWTYVWCLVVSCAGPVQHSTCASWKTLFEASNLKLMLLRTRAGTAS